MVGSCIQFAGLLRQPLIGYLCLGCWQVVNRMQMLDKGTAQIDWRLKGTFNGAQASAIAENLGWSPEVIAL